jgi:hypothetical protein
MSVLQSAAVCGETSPTLSGFPGDRTRSQRSGTRFPYTSIKMELDHEKQNVSFREIVYEYEYDWLGNVPVRTRTIGQKILNLRKFSENRIVQSHRNG